MYFSLRSFHAKISCEEARIIFSGSPYKKRNHMLFVPVHGVSSKMVFVEMTRLFLILSAFFRDFSVK